MSSPSRRRLIVIAAAGASGLALAGAHEVQAQSWASSTPGLWNDPLNWSPQVVPNAVGAVVEILGTASGGPLASGGTITFSAPVTVGSLNVDMGLGGPSLTLAPQQLTFDNGAGADVFLDGDGSLGVNITGSIVLMGDLVSSWTASNGAITATISGNFGIRHDPPFQARLKLWGNNTYTGETFTDSGRLSILTGAGLGAHSAGTTIQGQGVLIVETIGGATITGEPVSLVDGGRIWLREDIDWAEELTLVNSGEITPWFDDLESTVSAKLTGTATFIRGSAQSRFTTDPTRESILHVTNPANDYTDGTIIRAGVLSIPSDEVLGAAGTTIAFDQTGFLEGPAVLATSADATIPRDVAMLDDGWLRAVSGTTGTYTGVISGSRALSIGFLDWTGTVALTGANTYTGGTNVLVGALLATNTTGSATGTGAVVVSADATLGGDGSIAGAVDMLAGGALSPGVSPGALTVGAIDLGATTQTIIELAGAGPGQSDQLIVNGAAALDGDLTVSLDPAFTPVAGDEVVIVDAMSVAGTFATESLPPDFAITYEPTRAVLTFNGAAPCPADLNGSGVVDGADLGLLLQAWDPVGPSTSDADLNGDGMVDGADLGLLLQGWGACP